MSKEDSLIFQTAVNHNQLLEFTEEEVDPADLAQIMEAAMAAPSAYEEQPWRFFVGD